jgi:hypothetical protein
VVSLWDLIGPAVADGLIGPVVADLLRAVTVPPEVTALTAAAEDVGSATAQDLLRAVGEVLPIPLDGAVPDVPAAPFKVRAQLLGAHGWQAEFTLPSIDIQLPVLAPGRIEDAPGGRRQVVRDDALGPVTLHITSSAAAPATIVLRAPNGADVSIELGGATLAITPAAIALPGGFGARIGSMDIEPDGIAFPTLAFFLPPLPSVPVGEIPLALTFGRLAGRLAGLSGAVTQAVALPGAAAPGSLTLAIDRPAARTLLDLIPTKVEFSLPLVGGSFRIDPDHTLDPQPSMGGSLAIQGGLAVTEAGVTLHAELSGAGSENGLASIPGADLALAAAVAPQLLPAGARDAAATAILAILGGAPIPGADGGGEVVIHALDMDASWSLDAGAPDDLRIRLDYESRLGVSVGAGPMSVKTRPESPIRVRYRGVRVRADAPPVLSWQDAPMTLVSAGDWVVSGIPDDLLRVAGVRPGKGSFVIDLDLRAALNLGVVTVDQTTVRISLGGDIPVAPAGFGLAVDIPGVLTGHGQVDFPPDGGFGAALDISLPSIGASGRAVVAIGDPKVVVAFEARLFAPIPFANSGLGLFGISGALASGAARKLPDTPTDPIQREVAWKPLDPNAWIDGHEVFIGLGADIGTVPDMGFALFAKAGILIGVPDPMVRVSLEALLMRGLTGTLTGVLVVDEDAVTIGLLGEYSIPLLLEAKVPAGAIFPLNDPSLWQARLGGDGDDQRSGPVTIRILPDLLDLEAWAFLMVFGDASTIAGRTLAPPGLPLDGLSLAFGAGVDVHWSAGPFSFDAHGMVLAALTHKPPAPGSDKRPWMLAGIAEIRGSVDLGPVSIGASAHLDVIVSDSPLTLFGHAKACASIDLWLTSIEGCVEFDIGDRPALDVPVPESPLLGIELTDRRALIVAGAVGDGGDPPTVWPDTIPVLTFSHWVADASPIVGIGRAIGNAVPANDGWVGTAELEYRFDLKAVRVFEAKPGAAETEVGITWDASWQLPLSSDVWGAGDPPPEARALALGILDPHHRLQPATFIGPAAGDPISLLGRLCVELGPPLPTWFDGRDAQISANSPLFVPPRIASRRTQDLGPIEILFIDPDGNPLRLDDEAEGHAHRFGFELERPWVELVSDVLTLDEHVFDGRCWLPRLGLQDVFSPVVLRLTAAIEDALLYLVSDRAEGAVGSVRGPNDEDWAAEGDPFSWGDSWVQAWRSPGKPTTEVQVRPNYGVPYGLVALRAMSQAALAHAAANERGRKDTQEALARAAADAGSSRKMLKPGASYRIDVELAWSGRGKDRNPASGDFAIRSFHFGAAGKRPRPAPPGQPGHPAPIATASAGELITFKELAISSLAAMRRYDETVLDTADLARYVGAFVPADGVADHFLDDPVQVLFTVDHLPDLAAVYEEQVSVVAVRTAGPPDSGPADVATDLGILAIVVLARPLPDATLARPLTTSHLTVLDAAKSAFVDAAADDDPGCAIRRPGAVVEPLGRLVERSTYRLGVHVSAAPAGQPPEPPATHAPVAAATFRTSRYRGPGQLLADLGLTSAGGALGGLPLAATVAAAIPGLAGSGEHVGEGFEAATRAIGLGGYEAASTAQASILWLPDGGAVGAPARWLACGILVESPESIDRPGRLSIGGIRLDGRTLTGRYWDSGRTRLLALIEPFEPSAGAFLDLDVQDTPPGGGSVAIQVRGNVMVFSPLEQVLA